MGRAFTGVPGWMERVEAEPRPGVEEERELVRAAQRGDAEARDRLVRSHLRYVLSFARKVSHYGIPIAELVSEGTLGLLHAIDRFDPDRQVRFVTYASNWVRAHVLERLVREKAPLAKRGGVHRTKYWFRVRKARARLVTQGYSGDALLDAIAERLELPRAKVERMIAELDVRVASLDEPVGEGGTPRSSFFVCDRPWPEDVVAAFQELNLNRARVREALACLDEREREIVRRRTMAEEPMTLADLGRARGISRERVRQLESRALEKLRRALARPAA